MIDVGAAAAQLVATLQAAGVSACLDVRDLNTPGVLVPLPTLDYRIGRAEVTWGPYAAVANTGRAQALTELSILIDQVRAALLPTTVTAARPVDLAAVDGGGPLPAYELTFTTRLIDLD